MAGYSDYYSTIARAVSGLPGKTEEARGAVYELARTALRKRLSAFDPPMSETDLAIELFALEAAIQRVETESRFSDTRHGLNLISMLKEFVGSLREQWITKYPQIRIALRLVVAALVGIFAGIFLHWMTAEK